MHTKHFTLTDVQPIPPIELRFPHANRAMWIANNWTLLLTHMNRWPTLPLAVLCTIGASLLSGCMAAVLAPAVLGVGQIANGSRENVIQVTVDEKTFTPEVRASFLNAKSLAIVAGDRSAIKAADLFETRGGYLVSIDRPAAKVGEMTGSERRDVLRKLCANSHPDVAMMGRTTHTETGSSLRFFIGRLGVKSEWTMEMLVCRTNTVQSFGGTFEFDAGILNHKAQSEYDELIGAEIGGKILDAIGKAETEQIDNRVTASTSHSPVQTDVGSAGQAHRPISGQEPNQPPKTASGLEKMASVDIQKKLIELGYLGGKADGIMGKKSVDALKKFQHYNNLPSTGQADSETVGKLRQKTGNILEKL